MSEEPADENNGDDAPEDAPENGENGDTLSEEDEAPKGG